MYLLLIDNNFLSSRDIKNLLDNSCINCDLVVTSSGCSLIDLAEKLSPQIVIVDFDFFHDDPDLIIKKIRQCSPQAYIIAFTDSTLYHSLNKTIGAGINDYMIKPLHKEDILLRIKIGMKYIKNKVNKIYYSPAKVSSIEKARNRASSRKHVPEDYRSDGEKQIIRLIDENSKKDSLEDLENKVTENTIAAGDQPAEAISLTSYNLPQGAIFCDPEKFRYTYKLEQLRSERNGKSVLLCMLQLISEDNLKPPKYLLQEVMQNLKKVIMHSLRRGDLFTRWSEGLYLLMLPGLSREQAVKVMERIEQAFTHEHLPQGFRLRKRIETILPLEDDSYFK